ncbi:hypothetical protein [Solirubrobacter ginsenosidimutans]|uniref:hypothetical protein n=1 Tax=Solirubrobacter ginsenosidimutans TaxID=490573 RepID=UPI0022CDC134|nr:hypothetical protein [Solirubrobacter ginsenosidimutans]
MAFLCLLPAGTAAAAGVQQERIDLLNRAIKQVYAGAPSCKPPDPFAQRTTTTDADPSADLLNTFAIFRRPATAEELALATKERRLPAGGLYRRYARIVMSASGRRQLVLPAQNARSYQPRPQRCVDSLRRHMAALLRGHDAAFKRGTSRVLEQVIRDEWAGEAQGPTEGIFLFTYDGHGTGGGGGGADLNTLRTKGMFFSFGGGARPSLVTGLIPDGVASIELLYPATADSAEVKRTVAVRDNVVSYEVRRSGIDALVEPQMTWLAADGSVVRVVNPVTYVAGCGVAGQLEFKPSRCAAGSLNLSKVQWQWWDSAHAATGTGEALLRKGYRARAKIVLSRPLSCTTENGVILRYFSRARVSVLYRSGNTLGERPGWRSYVVKVEASDGLCELSP